MGQGCYDECGQSGYCPGFCGATGACCRVGWGNQIPECGATTLGCSDFHCCVQALHSPPPSPPNHGVLYGVDHPPLSHGGSQCYDDCGRASGACPGFCGDNGLCCRAGWDRNSSACGHGERGCSGQHCCVLPDIWQESGARPPMPPRAAAYGRCDPSCSEDEMGSSRCTRAECRGCPDCSEPLPHPLVVTAFIMLSRSQVKHSYDLGNTVRIPAPYLVYCGGSACDEIREAREDAAVWGTTTIITDYGEVELLTQFVAQETRVNPDRLRSAAAASTTSAHDPEEYGGHNCPSGDLMIIWLSKTLLLKDAMRRYPEQQRFAWVDAGFNRYNSADYVAPAPWLRLPEQNGAIAVRFYWNFQHSVGTCHNFQRGTDFSHCIYGAWMYGQRRAWQTFVDHLLQRLHELVETQDTWIAAGRKMLCSDQDILTETALAAPWMVQEVLPRNDWTWDADSLTPPGAWREHAQGMSF